MGKKTSKVKFKKRLACGVCMFVFYVCIYPYPSPSPYPYLYPYMCCGFSRIWLIKKASNIIINIYPDAARKCKQVNDALLSVRAQNTFPTHHPSIHASIHPSIHSLPQSHPDTHTHNFGPERGGSVRRAVADLRT